jgi:IS5 family transposase
MDTAIPWEVWVSLVEPHYYQDRPGKMRRFMGVDVGVEQVPDVTMLLHFRHVLEGHNLREKLLDAQNEMFKGEGWITNGGSIVDATILAAPSSRPASATHSPAGR